MFILAINVIFTLKELKMWTKVRNIFININIIKNSNRIFINNDLF